MIAAETGPTIRLHAQLPEPGRCWIRYAPHPWPPPLQRWNHLARAQLREGSGLTAAEPSELTGLDAPLDDLLHLPPVSPPLESARRELAKVHLQRGTPVLLQEVLLSSVDVAGGEDPSLSGAWRVYDLLEVLLRGQLEALDALPAGAWAVWPLIPGLTDDEGLWREACEGLAGRRLGGVLPQVLELTAAQRRTLAEQADDAAFHALFHRPPPSERSFARVAAGCGLAFLPPRPLPRPPLRGAVNRRVAGALLEVADLLQRLGRDVSQAQSCYRAGRWIDQTRYDVEALARDGNLAVIDAVDGPTAELVEEALATGTLALLGELQREYAGG